MTETSLSLRPSWVPFFSYIPNKTFASKLCTKNEKFFPNDILSEKPLLKQYLLKYGKSFGFKKRRFFIFADNYFYYKQKENSKKIKGVFFYDKIVAEFFYDWGEKKGKKKDKKEKLLKILLKKNGDEREFLTENEAEFKILRFHLRNKCILTTFQSEFQVIKSIGKGSFAKVYLCRRMTDNNLFAVKCFKKEFILTQLKGRESLLNEITIMRKVNHPNIIKMYEVFESETSIYLIIELLEGGELFNRLGSRAYYDEDKIITLMRNFISALCHLAKNNIIHRDLKPENILLRSKDNDTDVVLADFGLATEKLPIDQILFKRCGTPGFVAPEVLNYVENKCEFYDEKSDVFGAGIIFYILLSSKRPFEGKDCRTILKNNKKCLINFDLPEFRKVSSAAMDLLKKMLHPDPHERISAPEILKHEFLTSLSGIKIPDSSRTSNFINLQIFTDRPKEIMKNPTHSFNSISNSINTLLTGSNRFNEYYGGLNGKIETVDSLISNASILKNMDISPQNKPVSPARKHVMSNFAFRDALNNVIVPNGTSNNNFNPSSQREETQNNNNASSTNRENYHTSLSKEYEGKNDGSLNLENKRNLKKKSDFNPNNDIYKRVLMNNASIPAKVLKEEENKEIEMAEF